MLVRNLFSSKITFDRIKTYYPIQTYDLRFQINHVTPTLMNLSGEYVENQSNTYLYVTLIKPRESKMISDGKIFSGIEVIRDII